MKKLVETEFNVGDVLVMIGGDERWRIYDIHPKFYYITKVTNVNVPPISSILPLWDASENWVKVDVWQGYDFLGKGGAKCL